MNTERFERLRSIYERAEELPSGERADHLEESCGGDVELRGEIERMLGAANAPLFLERPRDLDLDAPSSTPLPERIGAFRVLELLGEGGFGAVYRAEQSEPVQRTVALKVLHPRRAGQRSRLRFEAERQTLARLQHAGIAQVHDAGETEDGQLYFAMELVDGLPITTWCDRYRLGVDERLALFRRVCAAIQYAHQRGVVHRDLKPGNVLVKDEDGSPIPKIIDFGVAKLLLEDEGSDLTATREGVLIGTPGYMSPEQAGGLSVDTRTDVYALGVLLYDLLTGDLPFARERLNTGSVAEVVRIVCEEEPRRLSTAVLEAPHDPEAVAAARGCKIDTLLKALRGDLEWVVRRALAKDPEARYATVSALAEDVERYLRNEPVAAREPAALYLLRKFVARHRLGVGIASAAIAVVTIGIAGLLWALREVDDARGVAIVRGREADRQRDAAVLNEYAAQLAAARAALQIGEADRARRYLLAAAPEHRGWEWRHLAAQCDGSLAGFDAGKTIDDVLWLDDERVLMFLRGNAEVRNVRTGVVERESPPFDVQYDGYSRDPVHGRLVVDLRTRLEVWDPDDWSEPGLLFEPVNDVRSMAVAPDGRMLATSENGGLVRLHDIDGELPPRVLCDAETYAWGLAFLDDGARLVLAMGTGEVQIREVETGALLRSLAVYAEGVLAIAVSADERVLYAASGKTIHAVELETGNLIGRTPSEVLIGKLRLSPDGGTLYGAGGWIKGRLTAWDSGTLEVVSRFNGHRRGIHAIGVHPDGERIASGGSDGTLRIWGAEATPSAQRLVVGYDARSLAVSADGEAFATADLRGSVSVWSSRTLEAQLSVTIDGTLLGCSLGTDEVFASGEGLFAVDRRTGEVREGDAPGPSASRIALDLEERWLVGVSASHGRVFVWRLPELELVHTLELPVANHLVYETKRRAFLIGGRDGRLRFLDPERGEVVEERGLPGATTAITAAGGQFAAATGTLHLLDPARDQLVASGHATSVFSIAYSPDGQRIATGGADTLLTLWNLEDTEMLVLDDAPKALVAAHFVAGGERLIALSHYPGSPTYLMVWDAPPRVVLDEEAAVR